MSCSRRASALWNLRCESCERSWRRKGCSIAARKRKLPAFPRRVAFVTSPTGAAIHDFLQVLRRRWRGVDVLVIPARVQGEGAAQEIVAGIRLANRVSPRPDVLIVGRGGGSLEDLWSFNEEPVVRAIAASKIPTVSAVGHEIDVIPAPAGYGPQFVWLDSGVYRRAQGLFYEASTLGNFCVFFLVMIAVAFTRPRNESPVSRKGLGAGGAVFFAALVLSYSRGSLVGLIIAVLAPLAAPRPRAVRAPAAGTRRSQSLRARWSPGGLPAFAEMYWLRLSATTEFLFTATEGVLSGRVATWRTLSTGSPPILSRRSSASAIRRFPIPTTWAPRSSRTTCTSACWSRPESWDSPRWCGSTSQSCVLRPARPACPTRLRSFCGAWILCFWAGEVVQMASGDLLTYWRVLPVYFWILALAVRL